MAVRATQIIASVSAQNLPHTLATQIVVEVEALANGNVRTTALQLEAHAVAVPTLRATAIQLEAFIAVPTPVRATWFVLEVFVWTRRVTMPDIYPTLPGLTYTVTKRPKWFTGIGTSVSGREVRYAYAATPLWEWDLSYEYLPDFAAPGSATASDFKTLIGFYLSQSGALGGFLFKDPDDYVVTAQPIGTTDGTITNWTLVRTFGGGDGTGTEPIGYLDQSQPCHVYLNGVLQDPSTYTLATTQPVAQVVKFNVAPGGGQTITVDMTFFYYVRFKEDYVDFDKFMDKLWSTKQITLMSQRG
jgi:uncharacterized protein (TIGR02217 family)